MKSRIIRIGNSKGVRIPKPLLEEAGLTEDVEMRVTDGVLVISPLGSRRDGWAAGASDLAERQRTEIEPQLLDPPTPTAFDDEEWSW